MTPADAPSELARLQARNRALEAENGSTAGATAARPAPSEHRPAAGPPEVVKLKEGWKRNCRRPCWNWPSSSASSLGRRARSSPRRRKPNWPRSPPTWRNRPNATRPPATTCSKTEAESESEQGTAQDPPRRKRRRRHPLPEHLERQTVVIEPEGLEPCAQCGGTPGCIGEEVTEELEYVPAKVVVRRIVRRKYACRCGCGGVQVAPLPPRLLPQSKLGLALAVYLLLARFDDHVAYYTLERIFRERHGVDVPRQQMVQWVEQIAFLLQPLVRLMFQRMKQGGYLQVDETPVKVMDPEVKGKCARGYLWFYAVPGGDVYLDFQGTRGRDAPHAQLTDFAGTIQTDAYEVYDALKKVIPNLVRIGCAAHARRAFHRALRDGDRRAIAFIARFRQLYRIEREARDLTPEHRHQLRQQQAVPIWEKLQQEAQALQPQLLPKSRLGKAVNYLLNEYTALTGYLQSGTYEIDNNLVENSIRVPAVGRRYAENVVLWS